jgi:hypothetical protein
MLDLLLAAVLLTAAPAAPSSDPTDDAAALKWVGETQIARPAIDLLCDQTFTAAVLPKDNGDDPSPADIAPAVSACTGARDWYGGWVAVHASAPVIDRQWVQLYHAVCGAQLTTLYHMEGEDGKAAALAKATFTELELVKSAAWATVATGRPPATLTDAAQAFLEAHSAKPTYRLIEYDYEMADDLASLYPDLASGATH